MSSTTAKDEQPGAKGPNNSFIPRRTFAKSALAGGAWAGLGGLLPTSASAADANKASNRTIGLAFGTYGMKTLTTEDALRTIAEIGYDGVEPALMPGWPTDPAQMSAEQRKTLRRLIEDNGLAVPAMLEVLPLVGTPQSRTTNLERLKRAVALGNELCPAHPPIVETILGGKTAEWDRVKGRMVDELKAWAKVAEDGQITVCFKPHAGDAVQCADRALWLIREVGSPRIRIVYDYAHFYVEGFPLESSLRQLFAYTPLIVVKDSEGTPQKHAFLLPGDGKTDYLAYFRLLKELGYQGFVAVEVSAMIHRKPDYRPVPTAKLCYARLAPLMKQAGLHRPEPNRRA
jgi:sugar phosphate isomerase/epimerase